jgi:hypothetical protein
MRIIVVVAASLGLAGCSSFSMPEMFKSAPPMVTVQMESLPAGAEARTSTGQTCKTPCAVAVPIESDFTVTFTLPKYQPETVPVQVIRDPASPASSAVDPNPVYAELQIAPPPKRAVRHVAKPKKPKPAPAAAAPAEPADSPFPPPPGR